MRITAISRDGPENRRLELYLDGERRVSLPEEVLIKTGIQVGDELWERELLALEAAAAAWAAREAALALLSRRARTRKDLRRRLLTKGHSPADVEICLEQLAGAGLLDDEQYARAFVRDRLRSRPKGIAALTAELRGKGVDPVSAEQAIRETLEVESVTELQLAWQATRKFRSRPAEDAAASRRRLYGFLSRRGFSGEAIRRILAEYSDSSDADDPDGA